MLDNIIGSIFFEFIGALIVWILHSIFRLFTGKKPKSFKSIFNGSSTDSKADIILSGSMNIIIGMVSVVLLCILLIKFYP